MALLNLHPVVEQAIGPDDDRGAETTQRDGQADAFQLGVATGNVDADEYRRGEHRHDQREGDATLRGHPGLRLQS